MCDEEKAITISLRGSPALREAMNMLAMQRSLDERRKVGVGELVRDAINQVYGKELKPWLDTACAGRDSEDTPAFGSPVVKP